MTPDEENALVSMARPLGATNASRDAIRLAIRAAYAQGREDAAKVCDDYPADRSERKRLRTQQPHGETEMSQPNDKRTVSTDALDTLGTLHTKREHRDAIHLAVEQVVASERLWPGDHIIVQDGMAYKTEPGQGLGIVDPFIKGEVPKMAAFWFVMYPRQVHSLRHVWTHPAFPEVA